MIKRKQKCAKYLNFLNKLISIETVSIIHTFFSLAAYAQPQTPN